MDIQHEKLYCDIYNIKYVYGRTSKYVELFYAI